jgi:amino acid adenylation domain-containing protein
VRFCGQDSVTFGAALPPFTKTVPMRIDAATRAAETAARETYELFTQIRNFLPIWAALLPEGDPAAAYSLSALFGYGLPEDHVWAEEVSGGAWPLAVIASEREETLLISAWAQSPADPATVCVYMRTALERVAGTLETAPDTLAASIDVMPEEERHKLIIEWNATGAAYPRDKCVHHLIEEQAARTPDAVAVVHDGRTLTYSQLNAQASQLAHHLRGLGVGPEALIAICVERGLEMVVGLLAILKAGGAYVPMDPSYPQERLAYMLKDSAPAALLTLAHLKDMLPAGAHSLPIIALDADAPLWAGMPDSNPDRAGLSADHLAYVIYTSGSTGMPKGVMVEHRHLYNYLYWAWHFYTPAAGSAVSSSLSFDATVTSIFTPLLCGGALQIVPEGNEIDGLGQLLCGKRGAGLVKITPAHLDAVGRTVAAKGKQPSASLFVVGGEALAPSTVRLWQQMQPDVRIVNEYGPTETVVGCVVYEVPANFPLTATTPIGGPIANTQIYILDARADPAPIGVAGELYIGGAGVARGYLNRPELTSQRFVADPFSVESGARMYKTGDLGRWTADGVLEYLGRNDFQVKIRGFRIELGEIEARLAEHESVRESVVLAREDSSGDKRLVAYYVSDVNIAVEALRAHLLAKLPEYMVPAAFVRLDRMPLSHNGKLERKALPAPDSSAYVQDAYEAPAGPVEEKLARIWTRLLGLERISRNANFFDLGGHSLLAVRMLMLIEAEFGHSLNLTSLFKAPSIASLSPLLQQGGSPSISSPYVVSIQPDGTKPPLFAIETPMLYRNIATHLGNNQPVIGLQLFNPAKPLEMKYSRLEDTAGECVRLIREIQPQGPYAVIGWCAAGVVAFETAQQLVQMGHEVSFIGILDGWAPDYVRRRGGAAWLKATDFASRCKRVYVNIRDGRKSVMSLMIKPLTLIVKPLNWFRRAPAADINPVSSNPELEAIEQFDKDLWGYLGRLQGAYEPKAFHGRVHSFVSQYRPTGWLADSSLGWGRLATEGVEVVTYEGEHRSIFDEPGAGPAAAIIAAGLEARSARTLSKALSGSATVRPNGQFTPTDPLVSIVIPAYNAEKDIAQAIRCAISQTYPQIEIIVVDDRSQDGTVQTAREILKSSCKGRWAVLELGVNRGASAARNVAVKQAKGEWIQFLDSDDAIAADKIEAQMKCARAAGPDVSAIYSSWRHVYLEGGNFVPAGPVNTPRYEGKHPLMFCMYYAQLHHGACLIRRSALERVQGFNETMRSYEDADLLVRLAKEIGRFEFVALSSPSYLWRLYKEQAREGGENARYKLEDTAMNWMRVVKEAAGNQPIGDILSSPDDMMVWGQHCTSYARRLFESNAGAFKLFMDELRAVDPDFTYP